MDRDPQFPKLPVRRRMLILLLAVATAITVVLTLLYPRGGVQRTRPAVLEPVRCAAGQDADCLGGTARVIVPDAAPAVPALRDSAAASAPGALAASAPSR